MKCIKENKTVIRDSEKICWQVHKAIALYEEGSSSQLHQILENLHVFFDKSNTGYLITTFPYKLALGKCYTIMLRASYDSNHKLHQRWAKNGFYCLTEAISQCKTLESQASGAFYLLQLILYAKNTLYEEFEKIISQTHSIKISFSEVTNMLIKDLTYSERIFNNNNWKEESKSTYLQIAFLMANLCKPLLMSYRTSLSKEILDFYYSIITNNDLDNMPPSSIFAKAKFISEKIEEELNVL